MRTKTAADPARKLDPVTLAYRRAMLPEVCTAQDVALALGVDEATAAALIQRGELGPAICLDGRILLRKVDFMAALWAHRLPSLPPEVNL